MRNSFLPTLLCAGLLGATTALAQPVATACQSTVSGDLRLHQLESRIFGNTRTIRVLLPPGYDAPENRSRRYPVLYMLDGQNLFDACLSEVSHHEWGLDETVYRLVAEKQIPPLIVVGVDHAGKDRAHEYLPYRDFVGNPDMDEPAGKRFPDFLAREVMPLVDGKYRTLPGQPNTGIGGSSYGGVATLYALLAQPGRFGYGLVESPTMWIGMGQLVRDTSPLVALPVKVFVAFGGKEGDDPVIIDKMTGLIRQVESNFRAAGYDDSNFRFVLEPDGLHTETTWAQRLPGALTFLFGDWQQSAPPLQR
jgi:predicted alpha/beta superfamily hydrolase